MDDNIIVHIDQSIPEGDAYLLNQQYVYHGKVGGSHESLMDTTLSNYRQTLIHNLRDDLLFGNRRFRQPAFPNMNMLVAPRTTRLLTRIHAIRERVSAARQAFHDPHLLNHEDCYR